MKPDFLLSPPTSYRAMEPRQRFLHDAHFHTLVNFFAGGLIDGTFDEKDIRDAVDVARELASERDEQGRNR